MKTLNEYLTSTEETELNEGLGTICLGVAGGLIAFSLFKQLIAAIIIKVGKSAGKKLQNELDGYQQQLADLIQKYPESAENAELKSIVDGDYKYAFVTNPVGKLQARLSVREWDKEDQDKFNELYDKVNELYNNILVQLANKN